MEKGSGFFGGKKGPFPWTSFPLSAPNGAYYVKWGKARSYPILFLVFLRPLSTPWCVIDRVVFRDDQNPA